MAVVPCPVCGADLELVPQRDRRQAWDDAEQDALLREAKRPSESEGGEP